ncbi:nucleotide exchange factor GrpE [Actinomadura atramentaria]|uniref:nucleotide exchange factor GrpE n=1 Tax=Actinomadura atramentaria TaxID=1990 RepID=UPI00037E5398|nr:nucleotide exchange factor GrpE [Actinomadura atramentaria]
MTDRGEEPGGPVIRDRRRIDPETGQVREPAATPAPEAGAEPEGGADDEKLAALQAQLDERTQDLQRLQAEYSNYRKRVDRDKGALREIAVGSVLTELLPILDDVGRARQHNELTGGFKSVGESLEATVGKLGLQKFGEPGEPFDPNVHEALLHSYSADVTETSVQTVLEPGYRIGDRVLRPARVAVVEPEDAPAESGDDE